MPTLRLKARALADRSYGTMMPGEKPKNFEGTAADLSGQVSPSIILVLVPSIHFSGPDL